MTNEVLLAIPLFIFMGVMLEQSRIAEDLLERMGRLFGRLRGGLGFSVVLVGALLAASTGIVGATAVTMGLIMLPAMLRHGYDPRLAAGTVAASATLAQIVPPSTVLVVLGDQLNNAYQSAQLAQGNFAPNVISVSDLFAGAILPGLLLVGLYLAYLIAVAIVRPASCPAVTVRGKRAAQRADRSAAGAGRADRRGARLDPLRHRDADRSGLRRRRRRHAARRAQTRARQTADAGGREDHADHRHDLPHPDRRHAVQPGVPRARRRRAWCTRAHHLPGGANGALLAVMLAIFLLGFVMDAFEIIFVVVPIVAPALLKMPGVDPVWLGIMIAVNLQTSYMHPPLGPTLFYLRGVAPPEITTRHIYVGIVPFVLIQLFALVVLWFVPGLATALPHALYGGR